jgi:hypothetical protein
VHLPDSILLSDRQSQPGSHRRPQLFEFLLAHSSPAQPMLGHLGKRRREGAHQTTRRWSPIEVKVLIASRTPAQESATQSKSCIATILKATRGLACLSYLLRHPGRDVHVSDLLATPIDLPTPTLLGGLWEVGGDAVTARCRDGAPILDSQAKAEYKQRIDELRNDLEEATRFNDSYRATRARSETDAIAQQLTVAVGLGGRDRRYSSKAERARSAVTKRIKEAINRITDVIPSLGRHLAARIKTGYFCSYNPHPNRPVAWKF